MKLHQIIDTLDLDEARSAGLVGLQRHPTLPLSILNYTARATFTPGAWNLPAVRHSRGIIFNDDGDVLARPWGKFFNYGDPAAGDLDLDAPVEVTDKIDGSLGILYPVGRGEHKIATRGSFDSDQAREGSLIWFEKYRPHLDFVPNPAWTYLFEIVYPENRIVLNYGDRRDLVLLGVVVIETGKALSPWVVEDWPGAMSDVMPYDTLREALEAPRRPNAEGLVVRYKTYRQRLLKLKQEDYVELHRIITGLNDRAVWERGYGENALDDLLSRVGDEFHDYVRITHAKLIMKLGLTMHEVETEFGRIMYRPLDRKAFAEQATRSEHAALLFMLYDHRDIRPAIWKSLRPRGDTKPYMRDEDVA